MKALLLLLLLVFSVSANAQSLKEIEWLAGTWNRTNVKAGRSAHERWIKTAEGLQGWGVNMSGTDTTLVEKLRIIIKDNKLYYVVDVPHNKESTYFLITEATANSFTCENPKHDFPKKITYQLEGNKLKATISGDGKAMDFLFERE